MYDVVYYWKRPDLWKKSDVCEGFFRQDDGADNWPVQILEASGIDETMAAVKSLNNCYAGVWEKDGKLFIVADHVRSIPLYYSVSEKTIFISDDAGFLAKELDLPVNPWTKMEFSSSGVVANGRTLYEGIAGTQYGEIVIFDLWDGAMSSLCHFASFNTLETAGDVNEFDELMMAAFQDIVARLHGRIPLIPLSGGHDSRTIATMLKRCGVKEALCYSFGLKGSHEVEVAGQLAKALGYSWKPIYYTIEELREFRKSEEWRALIQILCHGDSYHYPVAMFALKKILQEVDKPENYVYMPGHTIEDAYNAVWDDIKQYDNFHDMAIRKWFRMQKETKCIRLLCSNWFPAWHQVKKKTDQALCMGSKWRQEYYPKFYCDDIRGVEFWGAKWCLPLMHRLPAAYYLRLDEKASRDRDFWYRYASKFIEAYSAEVPYSDTVAEVHHGADSHRKWIGRVPKWVYSLARRIFYVLFPVSGIPTTAERIRAVLWDGSLLPNYYIVNDFIEVLKKQGKE